MPEVYPAASGDATNPLGTGHPARSACFSGNTRVDSRGCNWPQYQNSWPLRSTEEEDFGQELGC